MLNYIWLGLMLCAVFLGGQTGRLKEVTEGAFDGAKSSVTLALGLIGFMALWLGIMRIAERSGLVQILARGLRPIMTRLFPEVPKDHPAMGSIVMNMAANILGLNNAATPLGLRAMADLERLNPHPGTATNAMCTFLAINTSSITLIPATAVAILSEAKAQNPSAIIGTSLVATGVSTIAAVLIVKWLERWRVFRAPAAVAAPGEVATPLNAPAAGEGDVVSSAPAPLSLSGLAVLFGFGALFALWFAQEAFFPTTAAGFSHGLLERAVNSISLLAIPFLLTFFPLYAALRRVKVYEEFVEGAKEGFTVAIRIIPYLVAILVAVFMFRAAGGIDIMSRGLRPLLEPIGFPTDLLPLVLVRPLSGSATTGLFKELVDRLGPDDIVTRMAGTIYGSSETTFYVIAVYFGSVAIRRTRHAVAAGLLADLVGVIAAVAICRMVFG